MAKNHLLDVVTKNSACPLYHHHYVIINHSFLHAVNNSADLLTK